MTTPNIELVATSTTTAGQTPVIGVSINWSEDI